MYVLVGAYKETTRLHSFCGQTIVGALGLTSRWMSSSSSVVPRDVCSGRFASSLALLYWILAVGCWLLAAAC